MAIVPVRYHVGVLISTAIEQLRAGKNIFDGGTEVEIYNELIREQEKGHRIFAAGGCDNRKPDGSCAGHIAKPK